MDLNIKGGLFVVTGSTSGFGKAIAEQLIREGAHVVINARGEDKLELLHEKYPEQTTVLKGDITTDAVIAELIRMLRGNKLHGIVINAGGPPAKSFINTEISDWDNAYEKILRWKVKLTQELLEKFQEQNYGRILYIESAAVRQPIENLILSNSLRMAVVGFVKTLSQEVAHQGITLNILAPGYHATPAMERLFANKSLLLGISPEDARKEFEKETKVGHLGDPEDFASLAVWILSSHSRFITGQTISVDGGLIKGSL
ncbi:MAG: SDR family oxidoreductase [Saprospiraceae bacterium]|jgi:3-oxoacyl-[acyl-carrier protein] reductase|nr:SDR family oxidoreductase [Saprospiraceae bacterium]MBL0025483.1 SDR family oxidoreductase [Saprospiraceae bacterium]